MTNQQEYHTFPPAYSSQGEVIEGNDYYDYTEENIRRIRPGFGYGRPGFGRPGFGYGFGRPGFGYGFGVPFLGGLVGGALVSSLYRPPYYYGGYGYPGYGYPGYSYGYSYY